ncbi:dual specificity protein phosphatase 8 [Periophthalmus magnuspinnatus]|uniref:dual specificity protein phosphatase 8 n=1 Tax=Periophthalmus magnuspinnatus TaxID=409849 RepID=UPI00145B7ADC|nr:dual specificity protein phosphatase 8 [Periophthalmus magnuspinnatus]
MVWFGGTELERPPLTAILPRLYLGAESDVTQECLASLDISYVLNVSRVSPQPSFLPFSRFLRVPIDDSLSDDLLPWIPQALTFIDTALSSGASVLVHCAAGISRSPALTVAYIMHRLGLDLDHAYRFVKERRPSISPNLNFLGQLQHFQSTLKLGAPLPVTPEEPMDPACIATTASTQVPTDHLKDQAPTTVAVLKGPPSSHRLPKSLSLNLHGHNQDLCRKSLRDKRQSLTLSLTPINQEPPSINPGPPSPAERVPQHTQHVQRCPKGEHKEALLSPLSLTLNRLLSWGERILLAAPVRMGQPALPYSC